VICLVSPKLTGGSSIGIVEAETTPMQFYKITLTIEPLGLGTKFIVKTLKLVGTTKWSAGFFLFVRFQISVLISTRHISDVTSTVTREVTVNAPDTVVIFLKRVRILFCA
jgi:hypothetical protein